MKKISSVLFLVFILMSNVLTLTGCNNKKDYIFDIESISEKNISITMGNLKKGDSKKTSITILNGEKIIVDSNINDNAGVKVSIYDFGSKEELIKEDEVYSESHVITEGIQEGKYDIYFTVLDNNLNGTIEVTIE